MSIVCFVVASASSSDFARFRSFPTCDSMAGRCPALFKEEKVVKEEKIEEEKNEVNKEKLEKEKKEVKKEKLEEEKKEVQEEKVEEDETVPVVGMKENFDKLMQEEPDSSMTGSRLFQNLKGFSSKKEKGKSKPAKEELKGLKLLETYVRCVRFTMTIQPGKKPFADRCAELQQAVLAYPELQRHIAAGTIPKVPKATITTEATNQAKLPEKEDKGTRNI